MRPRHSSLARLTCITLSLLAFAQVALAQEPYGATDPQMGHYEGSWQAGGTEKNRLQAQIRPLGDGTYDGFVLLERSRKVIAALKLTPNGKDGSGATVLQGKSAVDHLAGELMPKLEATLKLHNKQITGTFKGDIGEGTLEATPVKKTSPTLGKKAPEGAKMVFDGKDTSQWANFTWKLVDGGAMEVAGGNITTKEKLTDFELHVEFRTPYMPSARGQARGNSGVYLQSIYEVQVLDSFGLFPLQINDCGSIYAVKTAQANGCLPPTEWQTYDITFHQGDTAKNEQPTITVVQNGITTIDNAQVPANIVGKGGGGGNPNGGFLMLQDHGDRVQYRNIWVRPLK